MSNKQLTQPEHTSFESLKHESEGNEFWYARELQTVLDYSTWDKFERVIKKAITACEGSGQSSEDHFSQVGKMVDIGSGAKRTTRDYQLSRYACYLIVQNGDASKPVIANGQTYFAIQTRRQELQDDTGFQQLNEDQKRLMLRNELADHNKQRIKVAKIHEKISNVRQDFTHKMISKLINENQIVGIETLRVKNMLRNKKLSKAVSDANFGEIVRQLEYKANWYGRTISKIDQWFPSSKMCSACGCLYSGKWSLAIREWTCDCG